jgi:hypothetical protein
MPMPRSAASAPSMKLAEEEPILLKDLLRRLSFVRSGRTLRTWILNGRKNPFTGQIVYLEYIVLPTGSASTMGAIKRFLAALNKQPPKVKKKKKKA